MKKQCRKVQHPSSLSPEHDAQLKQVMVEHEVYEDNHEELAEKVRGATHVRASDYEIVDTLLGDSLASVVKRELASKEKQRILWADVYSPGLKEHITHDLKSYEQMLDHPRYPNSHLRLAYALVKGARALDDFIYSWNCPANLPAHEVREKKIEAKKKLASEQEKAAFTKAIKEQNELNSAG